MIKTLSEFNGFELYCNSYNYMCTFGSSVQGNCTITTINPTNLTISSGVLSVAFGMENLTIQCNCSNVIDMILDPVRWFDTNGLRVIQQTNESYVHGNPYFTKTSNDRNVVLVIPTFNDSYDGIYSCGYGKNFPPKEPVRVDLTFGKQAVYM